MIPMRKVKIGLIAAAAVIIFFLIYSKNSENSQIEQAQEQNRKVLGVPEFGSLKIDESVIGPASKSGFITRDPITKKVVRVFGFGKLLNPEKNSGKDSEKWRLQDPYMQFFGDRFQCKITSDEGNFQMKEAMNKYTPQNARLYGNVKLEITFENQGVPTDGVVYLEDLDYDSERSELATDKSVKAVFDDVVMEGTGMILIYNSAKSRIEYFEMKDLDFIRIKDVAMLSKDRKNAEDKTAAAAGSNTTADETNGEAADEVASDTTGDPVLAAADNDSAPEKSAQEEIDYYHCRFLKDVNIEYGDELVVKGHEELNIKNLILSQSDSGQAASANSANGKTPDEKTSGPASSQIADSKKNTDLKDASSGNSAAASAEPADASNETTEVVLTCKEGFVVQLMSNVNDDKHQTPPVASTFAETMTALMDKAQVVKPQNASGDHGLIYAGETAELIQPLPHIEYASFAEAVDSNPAPAILRKPTRFHARKIDYDMKAKYAYATGPINLLIYGDPDPNAGPDQPQIPINITARDNAEYFGDRDQVVFNGDVEGMRKIIDELYVTENTVHGDQLVVDLDSSANENSISHISVLGENVELFSKRKAAETILTLIRLKCQRIDYDASDEFVEAKGPGVIEIDNSNAPKVESSEADSNNKITLQEPCYARIKDFDSLKWYTVANKVVADGSSDSVKIQHIPLVTDQPGREYGKVTYAAARNIEANFMTTADGRTELAALTASDTVSFKEIDGQNETNNFIGDNLFYDVANSTMLITGTEGNPCMANGLSTDKITYNMATRELVTGISGTSTIQLPQKPE
ncbi:MAG: hypothetical protein K9M75_11360 [Phycisphaerae bacterium]|nr:hypothetical protein [Phycisphaerae bacterium]